MERFYAIDGKFFRVMSKLGDLMILNLMWVIGSLPVITLGASTAALFKVTMEMADNKEAYVVKTFWRTFCQSLKSATIVWMLFLSVQTVLIFAAALLWQYPVSAVKNVFTVIFWMAEIAVCLVWVYVIPLQVLYPGKAPAAILYRAAFTGIWKLPWTVLLLICEGVLVVITCCYTVQTIPVWLLIGMAGNALLMSRIFLHLKLDFR